MTLTDLIIILVNRRGVAGWFAGVIRKGGGFGTGSDPSSSIRRLCYASH
jgi:hypothetical protein